ncbi:MAG TPA: translation elongation factor Ts, partial [Hyphomicrobium sp.]|nr:translation elongation factor Ts [Hyphomicrobium sp.]
PAAKGDLKALLAAAYPGSKNTVETQLQEAVATIGENMSLRRTSAIAVKEGVVADYIHSRVADGLGKIGVLVALESAGDEPTLFEIGRMLAMHVAAASPIALDISAVPADVIEREKAILAEKNQGKKPEMLEKIIAGGIKAFAKESCLLEQQYIHDTTKTVAQAMKEAESRAGAPIKVVGYVRYALGEGIDKKEEDFGEEVRKLASGG